jgi:hypothetical protein
MTVSELIEEYLEVLNEKATHIGTTSYGVSKGRKFAKVLAQGSQTGVHAFVDLQTGDVIKPATFKAPQKNADGTFAVRFNLVDDESRELLFEKVESSGAYLYLNR